MKILYRYVFVEIIEPFILGLVAFSFVIIPRLPGRPLELLVQKNVSAQEVFLVFAYVMPTIFTFSIPMATLLGILVCFGRLSADSEITAMRSSGISIRNMLIPVYLFAVIVLVLALSNSFLIQPYANYQLRILRNEIALKSISSAVRTGVFEEGFTNLVLYIHDATPDKSIWKGVFLADVTQRDQPKITLAKAGTLYNDIVERKLQLHLNTGATHTVTNKALGTYDVATFAETDIPIASLTLPVEDTSVWKTNELGARDLWKRLNDPSIKSTESKKDLRDVAIEFNKKLALPFCVVIFAVLGVPLGIVSRRGGKSNGFVISLIIFLVYFLLYSFGESFARSGRVSPYVGPWIADMAFLVLAVYLVITTERDGKWANLLVSLGSALAAFSAKFQWTRNGTSRWRKSPASSAAAKSRLNWMHPMILDKYIIKGFIKYFLLVLGAFVVIFVVFTFFELLNDIVDNQVPFIIVVNYFRYLLPQIIYYMFPMSVLVAVLVNFNVLTRTSQIVAMKASGISLYRLALSILLVNLLLSGFAFWMQESILPSANQKQDALRDRIKGRTPQTYLRPDRKWLMGEHDKIFNYNFFDEDRNLFGDISIFEFDHNTLEIKRRIYANRAAWDDASRSWIFEDGWIQGFSEQRASPSLFAKFASSRFPEISEDPRFFKKEVKQSSQMNYEELRNYIQDLKQSGFDVIRLTVALHKKISFPLVCLIMGAIAIPFSFSSGKRGSLYGIGVSILIGIIFWLTLEFFEQVGNAGKLMPFLAAWAPDLIFGAGGIYALFTIRT
ncbi:MAG: LPS export ABC transporter permease LptF [Terriglobia bacterium]